MESSAESFGADFKPMIDSMGRGSVWISFHNGPVVVSIGVLASQGLDFLRGFTGNFRTVLEEVRELERRHGRGQTAGSAQLIGPDGQPITSDTIGETLEDVVRRAAQIND